MRRKERREAGCVEAGAAKSKEVEKEALGGNGSGSGKSAWEEGGGSETESARSEAPPRRVRLRREKDGKENEMGVSAALEDGARTTTRRRRRGAAVSGARKRRWWTGEVVGAMEWKRSAHGREPEQTGWRGPGLHFGAETLYLLLEVRTNSFLIEYYSLHRKLYNIQLFLLSKIHIRQ